MKRALLVTLFILVPGEPVAAQTVVPCGQATYVTYASGRIAGVDWVDDRRAQVHSRSELTQSMVVDTTMTVGSDGSTPHASTIVTMAGSPPNPPVVRDIGGSTIFWSDSVPSSVQVAITRARVISRPSAQIQATSLFSSLRGNIDVRRVDEDDWIVAYHNKHYLVLTDDKGCVMAASLPDNGVVIERRANLPASEYPLWPPYAAPPDRAYAERDIGISAPQGYRLAGTLTVPWRASKPVPAAVLITGLSPHERNNGTSPWMPFRDVADALARAGFAVLRVDDRGVGASTGDNAKLTTSGKADDVRTDPMAALPTEHRSETDHARRLQRGRLDRTDGSGVRSV
ncbi:MAG TPA: hypothetical protein VJN22_05285, partial [Candidatus Eremiobacteraceae bacterium]|nr:hypothetical protein [Candidatus Eremiobacteraceae bacterium]